MIVGDNDRGQRWRLGRSGFVLDLDRGVFDPTGYEVEVEEDHAESRAFVMLHHYSKSWSSACVVIGVRYHGKLVGVSVYGQPGGPAVLAKWFPNHAKQALELSRLVMLDEVKFNVETWKTARDREILWRLGYIGVVSFADPMPRDTLSGDRIMPGHCGTTYAAASAIYTGQTARETQWLLDDGTVFPSRGRTKIRAYAAGKPSSICKGWEGAARRLVKYGAPEFNFEHGDPAAADWCDAALAGLARERRHPGQHRYLWAKRGGARRDLERRLDELEVKQLPYPRLATADALPMAA